MNYYGEITDISNETKNMLYILRKKIDKHVSNFQALCDTCESTDKLQKVREYLHQALGKLYIEETSPSWKQKVSHQKSLTNLASTLCTKENSRIKLSSDDKALLSQKSIAQHRSCHL